MIQMFVFANYYTYVVFVCDRVLILQRVYHVGSSMLQKQSRHSNSWSIIFSYSSQDKFMLSQTQDLVLKLVGKNKDE